MGWLEGRLLDVCCSAQIHWQRGGKNGSGRDLLAGEPGPGQQHLAQRRAFDAAKHEREARGEKSR